jgi:hypothetical protein
MSQGVSACPINLLQNVPIPGKHVLKVTPNAEFWDPFPNKVPNVSAQACPNAVSQSLPKTCGFPTATQTGKSLGYVWYISVFTLILSFPLSFDVIYGLNRNERMCIALQWMSYIQQRFDHQRVALSACLFNLTACTRVRFPLSPLRDKPQALTLFLCSPPHPALIELHILLIVSMGQHVNEAVVNSTCRWAAMKCMLSVVRRRRGM